MKTACFLLPLLLPAAATASGNRGVIETNYEAGAGYDHSDLGDSVLIDGRLTMPLSRFGGLSLLGDYDHFNGDSGVLDSDSYTLGGEAFLRDFDTGRLSAGFRYRKTDFERPRNLPNFDDTVTAKTYALGGEYYFDSVSLTLSRYYTDLERSDNVKSWGFGGLFYARPNIRVGISGNHSDDKTSYGGSVAFQPALFRNSTEISLGYFDTGDNNDIYSVSVAYHFSTRPTLIDRDRRYR